MLDWESSITVIRMPPHDTSINEIFPNCCLIVLQISGLVNNVQAYLSVCTAANTLFF